MKNASAQATKSQNEKTAVMTIAKIELPAKVESAPGTDEDKKAEAEKLTENFGPIKKQVQDVVKSLQPSAEERIKRVKNFEILSERYNFLKGKADDLSRFLLQNAGTNARLIFKNQSGADFEISNSFVIEKALTVAAEELKILLLDTENEVLNYEI